MTGQLILVCTVLAGVLIGILFFGGLWWTVLKAMSSRQPGLLFAASFLLRTLLTLVAFYIIGSASWQRLLLCLLGFVLGRMLVQRMSKTVLFRNHGLLKEGVR